MQFLPRENFKSAELGAINVACYFRKYRGGAVLHYFDLLRRRRTGVYDYGMVKNGCWRDFYRQRAIRYEQDDVGKCF